MKKIYIKPMPSPTKAAGLFAEADFSRASKPAIRSFYK